MTMKLKGREGLAILITLVQCLPPQAAASVGLDFERGLSIEVDTATLPKFSDLASTKSFSETLHVRITIEL